MLKKSLTLAMNLKDYGLSLHPHLIIGQTAELYLKDTKMHWKTLFAL